MHASERFRLAIAETPFDVGAASRTITASFGIALTYGAAESAEAVVAAADQGPLRRQGRRPEPVCACLICAAAKIASGNTTSH